MPAVFKFMFRFFGGILFTAGLANAYKTLQKRREQEERRQLVIEVAKCVGKAALNAAVGEVGGHLHNLIGCCK